MYSALDNNQFRIIVIYITIYSNYSQISVDRYAQFHLKQRGGRVFDTLDNIYMSDAVFK